MNKSVIFLSGGMTAAVVAVIVLVGMANGMFAFGGPNDAPAIQGVASISANAQESQAAIVESAAVPNPDLGFDFPSSDIAPPQMAQPERTGDYVMAREYSRGERRREFRREREREDSWHEEIEHEDD